MPDRCVSASIRRTLSADSDRTDGEKLNAPNEDDCKSYKGSGARKPAEWEIGLVSNEVWIAVVLSYNFLFLVSDLLIYFAVHVTIKEIVPVFRNETTDKTVNNPPNKFY